MKISAIVPAAGAGRRMGGMRKAFLTVAGKPLLQHSLDVLLAYPGILQIVVPLSSEDLTDPPDWLRHASITLVPGGAERADSVRAGVAALPDHVDAVIIHDAARPLINADLIDRVLEPVRRGRSATLALQSTDTLHEVDPSLQIRATPDRSVFWRAQTPQAFPRDILAAVFRKPAVQRATDEAGLVAAAGWPVDVVAGEPWNIKVTTPDDVTFVESMFAGRAP